MTLESIAKTAMAGTSLALVALMGMFISSPRSRADDSDTDAAKIQEGLAISPVPLNLVGRDRNLVGLVSYIVNAQAVCNDCHSLFPPPPDGTPTEYTPAGNPYLLSPPEGRSAAKYRLIRRRISAEVTTSVNSDRERISFPEI
jgi:hypothetical protein